jgi:predicted metal-dependent phosphoesterase TrpH
MKDELKGIKRVIYHPLFCLSFILHHSLMPRHQPFTVLCQLAARGPHAGRADLHVHTTASDGTCTAAVVVDLARRAGLAALAVTDHDTLAAVPAARACAAGCGVEIVPGVEITAEHAGRELHLLAYFVALDHPGLNAALDALRAHRVQRFAEMIERLRVRGVSVDLRSESGAVAPDAVGRRHLAHLLVRSGRVATVRDAFRRYLHDRSEVVVPKKRLPAGEALALVRAAGGVAAWAHPTYDETRASLTELRALGLRAVEVEYPGVRPRRVRELRAWAEALGLAVTGGSDCHGPGRRSIGARTVSAAELDRLRREVDSRQ